MNASEFAGLSPWSDNAELISNNNKYKASFPDGSEVAMGAPTSGYLWLYIEDQKKIKISNNACASFITTSSAICWN